MRIRHRTPTAHRHKRAAIARVGVSTLCVALLLSLYGAAGPLKAESAATKSSQTKEEPIVEPPRQPSAAEILQELMKKQQARPAIMPSRPTERVEGQPPVAATEPSVSPSRQDQPLLPDGTTIADRVGRIVRRQNGWYFVFESEAKVLREPPLQILPNKDLETMEIQSANGTRPVRFRVSGEVTEYRGANHLLLRKVLVVHDLGNLK